MAESNKVTEVRSEHWEPDRERQVLTYKATQFVWLILFILEGLFGLRFLLKLIGANPHSPIAGLIYTFSGLLLAPFSGLTVTPAVDGIVLEISTLFAMLVYGLIFWAIQRLLWLIFYTPRGSVIDITETESHQDLHDQHKP